MTDLDHLSALDPMRDFEPAPERHARAAAALDQMFEQPLQAASRRPGSRRLALGGVAAAAVGAVTLAAVLLVPGKDGNRAYASWTATPDTVAGVDVLPQARQCAAGWTDWRTPPSATDILLAERRGEATLMLVVKDGVDVTSCLVLDPAQGAAGADLLNGSAPAPLAGRVRTETIGATEGSEGWYSDVIGRAGAGVTKVEIELPDGTAVRASLRDGWWAAWWPGRAGGKGDGVRIVVHTADGSRSFLPSEL